MTTLIDYLVSQHATLLIVILILAIVVFFVLKFVFGKSTRRIMQVLDDWQGEPARPGISDGQPGVMQRLYSMDQKITHAVAAAEDNGQRLTKLEKQFLPNGGATLRDQTNRIEAHGKRQESNEQERRNER